MKTDRITQALASDGTSFWLKGALIELMGRDPVDASQDAAHLADLLQERTDLILYGPNVAEGKAKVKAERLSHFDYAIQAWVDEDGAILRCGHGSEHYRASCTGCTSAGLQASAVRLIQAGPQ